MIGDENIHLSTSKMQPRPPMTLGGEGGGVPNTAKKKKKEEEDEDERKKERKGERKRNGKYRNAVSKIDEIPMSHLRSVTLI